MFSQRHLIYSQAPSTTRTPPRKRKKAKMKKSKSDQALEYSKHIGYSCDDQGNVFSPNGRAISIRKSKGGYRQITLPFGKHKNARIRVCAHRFIAYIRFGDRVFEADNVRHLNGNPADNSKENLTIGSKSDNELDKKPQVRLKAARNAAKFTRALNSDEVKQLRIDRENGLTYKVLCNKYGISKSTVSYIVNQKTYRAVD